MGSEDVGQFTLDGKIPGVMFRLGASDPGKPAHAKETDVPLPGVHSPLFAPDVDPALHTGIAAEVAVLRNLLNGK